MPGTDAAPRPGAASNPAAAKTVWVIEDNPDHALLIATQLESLPAFSAITVSGDGEQALRQLQSWPGQPGGLPALVLLDLQLPRVSGAEVLRALRASEAWRQVQVVVLSTSASPSDIQVCYRYGANAYLTKGLHLSHLAERVAELTASWSAR